MILGVKLLMMAGSRARYGTGCYWAQKRKGQAVSRKNQPKRLETQPVQRVWVKSFTREDTLYRQMQSHQNSDWKRIKSENMRRSLIKRAKPLLVAQIIFSFFSPVPSIYSSPAGALRSASFVETILLEFPIDWICETINAGFPPVWELLGGVRGSGLELVWDFRASYWQCFLILISRSCVFIFLWFHFFFAFLHRPREAHICGGRGWTPPVIITRQTCHQESHYKECQALLQWKI